MSNAVPTKNSRRPFWLALALFFVPLACAFLIYYGSSWRPVGGTNRGDLVTPARPLPHVSLTTVGGKVTDKDWLTGKWSLVFIGDGACDAKCRTALVNTRQVRLALGDDMNRVQRVFLYVGGCCEQPYFANEQAGLVAANVESEAGKTLLAIFPRYAEAAPENADRTYIVDPSGNLMMSYPADAPAKGMLEDMKKLLKLSHIG
jgi:cytochrome oxidase Cu insertion factor (SCO1/SenC/PrrC family)